MSLCGRLVGHVDLSSSSLVELQKTTRLNSKELRELYTRFRRIAPQGELDVQGFRATLGMLGMLDDTFLADRMFKAFDTNGDGNLDFPEFAAALGVMTRGTDDEKLDLSFRILNPGCDSPMKCSVVATTRRLPYPTTGHSFSLTSPFSKLPSRPDVMTSSAPPLPPSNFAAASGSYSFPLLTHRSNVLSNHSGWLYTDVADELAPSYPEIPPGITVSRLANCISLQEFRALVEAMESTRCALVGGQKDSPTDEEVEDIFNELATSGPDGVPKIHVQDFKLAVRQSPEFLRLLGVLPHHSRETPRGFAYGRHTISPSAANSWRVPFPTCLPVMGTTSKMSVKWATLDNKSDDSRMPRSPKEGGVRLVRLELEKLERAVIDAPQRAAEGIRHLIDLIDDSLERADALKGEEGGLFTSGVWCETQRKQSGNAIEFEESLSEGEEDAESYIIDVTAVRSSLTADGEAQEGEVAKTKKKEDNKKKQAGKQLQRMKYNISFGQDLNIGSSSNARGRPNENAYLGVCDTTISPSASRNDCRNPDVSSSSLLSAPLAVSYSSPASLSKTRDCPGGATSNKITADWKSQNSRPPPSSKSAGTVAEDVTEQGSMLRRPTSLSENRPMYMNRPNFEGHKRVRTRKSIMHAISRKPSHKAEFRLLAPSKGLAVHFGHESWNMMLNMMVGIRLAAGRANNEPKRKIEPYDFIMKEKFSILPRAVNILANKDQLRAVRFIDYAPLVFRKLRELFGVSAESYLRSVGPEQLLGNMVLGNLSSLSELVSEGKSGAFFYYTADGKFMIKTVPRTTAYFMRGWLSDYYHHCSTNPDTMITRFFGFHAIRLKDKKRTARLRQTGEKLYLVVMGNFFHTPVEIHRRYDLKGSWIGRQLHPGKKKDKTIALKDMDIESSGDLMVVGPYRKRQIREQLFRDTEFLRRNLVMDYSLLLGIHFSNRTILTDQSFNDVIENPGEDVELKPKPFFQRDDGGMLSLDNRKLYYLGIIDISTKWTPIKRLEFAIRSISTGDPKGISCVHPNYYAERFRHFINRHIV